jgi:hypothetical protein
MGSQFGQHNGICPDLAEVRNRAVVREMAYPISRRVLSALRTRDALVRLTRDPLRRSSKPIGCDPQPML